MPEQRNLFDLAAADAASVRTAARDELAVNLANEILKNPAKFDPKRLKALGSQGFLVLLAKIRQHEVHEPEPLRDTSAGRSEINTASSWQHLRKPEPNHWLRSVAAGLGSGLIVIAAGLAAATFS
jgi:hypothetical protein